MVWTSKQSRSLVQVIQKYLKLYRHSGASITSEKGLGPPGSLAFLYILYKNVYKLYSHFGATTTAKMLRTSRHSRSLLQVIQEYLQALQTLWNLQSSQEFCKSHTKIFTSLTDILELLQLQKKS